MQMTELDVTRSRAWTEAKGAVRAYARDPSSTNADKVQAAWEAIRRNETPLSRGNLTSGRRRGSDERSPETERTERTERIRKWRGLKWPINEVVLQSLVNVGKSDYEIASLCGVDPVSVLQLRAAYEI